MNDEIKEILDCLELAIDSESYKTLLDYITNLQQENEIRQQDINNLTYQLAKMKEENERLKEDLKGQEKLTLSYCKSEQDYKSRCEKASKILKKLDLDKYTYTKENRKHTINDLLNTLQNGSDSQ